jgi:hypothetical protein
LILNKEKVAFYAFNEGKNEAQMRQYFFLKRKMDAYCVNKLLLSWPMRRLPLMALV